MARQSYEAQVALLVRVLPHVAKEEIFALKGGTAINLFYRDLPRLSVDIDLTYLPIKERAESLVEINEAMDRIAASIEGGINGARAQRILGGGGGATRVLARLGVPRSKSKPRPSRGALSMTPKSVRFPRRWQTRSGMQKCKSSRSKTCSAASYMPQSIASTRATFTM